MELAVQISPRWVRTCWGVALAFAILPLWVGKHLPLVDLPQHLHLISVLHRLGDPSTLYPRLFALRGQLTPYLGYYYLVSALNWLLPLEVANKVFLSLYVAGIPLSLAFLLKSCGRPTWPAILALPFAYGDSFAWGFINYCCAIPLALLCCGCFIRSIGESDHRWRWSVLCGLLLIAVLLFHVQLFLFLALALPAVLLTTRAPEDAAKGTLARPFFARLIAPRRFALSSVIPGVMLFIIWVVARFGEPTPVEYGAPWKAWGPLLSPQNLSFKTFEQNRAELFQVLANMLRDGSDRYSLYLTGTIAIAACALGSFPRTRPLSIEGPIARWRVALLGAIAFGLYFTLPFDIRGTMYYLNTRFAHLAACLLVCALPPLLPRFQKPLLAAASISAVVLGATLTRGFAAFADEASALDELAMLSASKPMVMGLIFDTSSRAVRHPVFLHSATVIARERGGAANFSFAITPHSPIRYQREPPPTFPSEWRPDQFSYQQYGRAYDHFLIRGVNPRQVFGSLLDSELYVAGQSGTFSLVRRR